MHYKWGLVIFVQRIGKRPLVLVLDGVVNQILISVQFKIVHIVYNFALEPKSWTISGAKFSRTAIVPEIS